MKSFLFKPWKIKAIAESSPDFEWQTRRLAGLKEINQEPDGWTYHQEASLSAHGRFTFFYDNQKPYNRETAVVVVKPHFQVGDVVYIKEGIHRFNMEYASYDSDFTPVMFLGSANRFHWRWQRDKLSSMFLPAVAARYFIKITDVRVEKLQEITEEDCLAEGIEVKGFTEDGSQRSPIACYEWLWDSINPKHPWLSNPWCFVYSFKKVNHKEE